MRTPFHRSAVHCRIPKDRYIHRMRLSVPSRSPSSGAPAWSPSMVRSARPGGAAACRSHGLRGASPSLKQRHLGRSAALFRRTAARRADGVRAHPDAPPRISEILSDTENLSREARAVLEPNRRLLRVAFSQLIDARRLSALIEPFRHAVPDVEVVFKECDVGGLEARLDDEQVDVACGLDLADRPSRDRCLLYLDPLRFIEGGSETRPAAPLSI